MPARRPPFLAVAALFLVSGATGLVYEVAFSKYLSYVFGATAYAVSAVLAAFMGGLAIGAHLGGRADRRVRRPLVAYGALELAVGLACAVAPATFDLVAAAYVRLARAAPGSLPVLVAVRWTLATACVLVPTSAMGATFPLLSRAVAGEDSPSSRRRLGWLYALNTCGGASGSLLGAYVVLPALGLAATMRAAAVANVAIGLVAIALGRSFVVEPPPPGANDEAGAATPRTLVALAATSGLLVFAAEVVFTHLLALIVGNSVYAFGVLLAVFLVCLGLGAAAAPALARRLGDSAIAWGLALSALSLAVTLPLWDRLPSAFDAAAPYATTWGAREVVRGLVALAILALPTFFLGTTFPLTLQAVAHRPTVSRDVGRLTVANTLGSIAGSLVAGYAVLPRLGSQRSLAAVALAYGATSLALVVRSSRRRRFGIGVATALAVAALGLAPRWDLARLTSGANVYFDSGPRPDAVEMLREDVHGGVTTVWRQDGLHVLYTNGKFQGDDGPEMDAERGFAHFPAMFAQRHARALVIGLGTGTTLGTVLAYPFERVDVAEISPAIVEAARTYFTSVNRHALDDPRVHLALDDGRNVLLVAREPYDLVTVEISSIWFAGAANLYSRDFYALAASRLGERGVFQQWVQLHHIRRREVATILATVRTAFPHVALFVAAKQGIIVASRSPLVASREALARLSARPSIRATLPEGKSLDAFADDVLLADDALERFLDDSAREAGIGRDAMISTDDDLYLEYATPKGNVLPLGTMDEMIDLLARYRTPEVVAGRLSP